MVSVVDLGDTPSAPSPDYPDSFVLTYKFYASQVGAPYEVGVPPTGNPESVTRYGLVDGREWMTGVGEWGFNENDT